MLKEENKDLFSVDSSYCLVQCISADFAMGKGIAVEFNRRFDIKHKLFNVFCGNVVSMWDNSEIKGNCIKVDNVLNLITKRNYWQKPTYNNLTNSLNVMKTIVIQNHINKIAMPMIGCGLDKLEWDKVKEIILNVFSDIDVEILVCKK